MFDFEKLQVYQKSKSYYSDITNLLAAQSSDKIISNQLKRAALSIPLNIAEGTGRHTKADQKNFYVNARGSVFECVAILDILCSVNTISQEQKKHHYDLSIELSKMLFAMIQRLEAPSQIHSK